MHELSIAMALVDIACEASDRLHVSKIEALHVSIGPLCGVVEEALAFSFELAAAGTPVEGARLVVQQAPLTAFCDSCNQERTIPSPQHLRCPSCGAPTPEVRSGRELELVAMEIPDVPDRADSSERTEEKRFARS